MATFVETDHPRNHPTGRTRFSEKANSAPEDGLTASSTEPFVFDGDFKNNEQVRPFFAEYSVVRAELVAAGEYPYDDSFKGRIPSLAGATDRDEDTAIYLLQTMHALDALAVRKADFLAGGGVSVETVNIGETVRGTVACYGFYVGGTGWREYEDARLTRDKHGRIIVRPRGKRNGFLLSEGRVMVNISKPQRRT